MRRTRGALVTGVQTCALPISIRFHAFGGPEVLSVDEVPTPKAGRGEVLVRVEAAWVNPVDYKIRNGGFVPADQLPMAAGREVAGVVAQCGAGTTDRKSTRLNSSH